MLALLLAPILQNMTRIAATAAIAYIVPKAADWLHVQTSVQTKNELEDAVQKSLQFGFTTALDQVEKGGWNSQEVRDQVIQQAGGYLLTKFRETLQRSGLDPDNAQATLTALTGILARNFPVAATLMAQSPATPADPAVLPAPAQGAVGG